MRCVEFTTCSIMAILAPSTCNTQPWAFAVYPHQIRMYADTTRWLEIADPEQRELHISGGCALENLLIAACHFGFECITTHAPEPQQPDLLAIVELEHTGRTAPAIITELFRSIPRRRTNHKDYDARPIDSKEVDRLRACCTEQDIALHLTDDPDIKRRVDELNTRAEATIFSNPLWRQEFGHWLGEGVFGDSWWMAKLAQLSVSFLNLCDGQVKKDSELLMHSPVLGLLSSVSDDKVSRIRVGQAFERLFLTATTIGISVQPMSQIVEVPEIRARLGELLPGDARVPQQPFRLGYAEPEDLPRPRRPLASMIIPT